MTRSDQKKRAEEDQEDYRTMLLHGWVVVCGIAFIFVVYGFFAFFVIGDKQPADWDFGNVQDIPGQSPYSTYPYRFGTEPPELQHVDQKPPSVITDIADNPPVPAAPPIPEKEAPRWPGRKSLREKPGQGVAPSK
jgi:hypothetical protein